MRCLRLGFVWAAFFAALPLGCGETQEHEPSPAVTYIGVVQGTETRIAILRTSRALEAYVCGQGSTLESHTRWFQGAFQGALGNHDAGTGEIESEGWHLRVHEGATNLTGELVAPSGETLPWIADRVAEGAPSVVGLYESHELGCRTGVIVWQANGADCPSQGVWCDEAGERGQVTPAECAADGTVVVRGVRDGTEFELAVERVQSP
jgi:hypothetical protein